MIIFIGLLCFYIVQTGEVEWGKGRQSGDREISQGKEVEVCQALQTKPSLKIQEEEFLLQRDRDDHGRFMSVSIKYPKFTGMEDLNLDNVNSLVKEAAFVPLCDDGSTVEDAVAALEKEQENLSTSTSCDVDYKLLYVGDDYISLVFHMFACVGGPSAVHDYMVALDIKEGRCVYFNDYADTSQALSAIVSGEFTVYEGTCNDVTEEYVHNSETCSRLAKIFRENIYAGGPDGKFDRYSSQNIGLDEEGLYIFISVPDQDVVQSFHGYFILRIPLESIKEPKKRSSRRRERHSRVMNLNCTRC